MAVLLNAPCLYRIIDPMLLTDSVIDELHAFRIEMMARSALALREVYPDAAAKSIGGGFAKFAGDGSPMTQCYGVGHRGASVEFENIDAFYAGLAENWELILTPFAGESVLKDATRFGYLPDHFETVLAQIASPSTMEPICGVEIRQVGGDLTEWMRVSDAGWSGRDDLSDEVSALAKSMAAFSSIRYLATVDDEPAATASMVSLEGKFLFAGACTRPKFRGRGLQRALTQRRLFDAGAGAFVQVVALPGSQSHRNLQRVGFQPLYSKLVMFRK